MKKEKYNKYKKSVLKICANSRNLWQKKSEAFHFYNNSICLSFFFSFLIFFASANSIEDSLQNKKTKKIVLCSTSAAVAGGSLIYLNQIWYKEYSSGKFHFFNDNNEWLQVDKVGHAFTTYNTGRLMMGAMKQAGFSKNKSIFIGGTSGLVYMAAVELMDGFSTGWGFSLGDMAANFGGTALAISQQYFWNDQRINLKYSFHQTSFPQYRPNLLGSNLGEQITKDYNGQTYWLSLNIASFFKKENKFPKWLNLAFGYGAEGMISGDNNYVLVNSDGSILGNNRYRKYLFSFDVDFSKIKTKSHFLKSVFSIINCVKIPFPSLEFNKKGTKLHALYF